MAMKRYIIILAAVIFAAIVSLPFACKKSFLQQTDTFAATADATFTKSSQADATGHSVYDSHRSSDLLKKSIWYYANLLTHDWYNTGNDIVWNYYGIGADFCALP